MACICLSAVKHRIHERSTVAERRKSIIVADSPKSSLPLGFFFFFSLIVKEKHKWIRNSFFRVLLFPTSTEPPITCVFTLALFSWLLFFFYCCFPTCFFFNFFFYSSSRQVARFIFNSFSSLFCLWFWLSFFPSLSVLHLIPSLCALCSWCYVYLALWPLNVLSNKTTFEMRAHQIPVLHWLQVILTWISQACNIKISPQNAHCSISHHLTLFFLTLSSSSAYTKHWLNVYKYSMQMLRLANRFNICNFASAIAILRLAITNTHGFDWREISTIATTTTYFETHTDYYHMCVDKRQQRQWTIKLSKKFTNWFKFASSNSGYLAPLCIIQFTWKIRKRQLFCSKFVFALWISSFLLFMWTFLSESFLYWKLFYNLNSFSNCKWFRK